MQCQNCGQRPAAVHLTQIKDDQVTAVHLCEVCAEEQGVQTGAGKFPLAGFLASAGSAEPANGRHCEFCKATLQDFRDTGRLGCPHCYETFESHLRELLERIHGSSRHAGKVHLPPAAIEGSDTGSQITRLREDLQRAVEAEDFELAAELRDRIKVLE